MSSCAGIPANPDVSGIGIRVNLYTTTLLLALIPRVPTTIPLLDVLTTNAGVSGASLIITAIIQTTKGELSLYHAIFIIHMLFFLGATISSSAKYPSNRALLPRIILASILTYAISLLYAGWSLYIWFTVKHFGINSECNDYVRYIFFFRSFRATVTWLVVLWKVILGLTAALLILIPCILGVIACMGYWGTNNDGEEPGVNVILPLSAVYSIVMLELYVKRNRGLFQDPAQLSQELSWSFGQVLSIVMVLSTLNEILHFSMDLWWERKDARSRAHDEGDSAGVSNEKRKKSRFIRLPNFLPIRRKTLQVEEGV